MADLPCPPYNIRMPTRDPDKLLMDAGFRARALLDDLLRQQAEIDASPPALTPAQLEAGRQAFRNSVDAARRMLHSIDHALARADKQT
jgi:hypothetical protein